MQTCGLARGPAGWPPDLKKAISEPRICPGGGRGMYRSWGASSPALEGRQRLPDSEGGQSGAGLGSQSMGSLHLYQRGPTHPAWTGHQAWAPSQMQGPGRAPVAAGAAEAPGAPRGDAALRPPRGWDGSSGRDRTQDAAPSGCSERRRR